MNAYQRLYFGEKWDAPSHDDATQTETPIGEPCYMCEREIVEGDQGWVRSLVTSDWKATSQPVHLGCEMGTTIGHTFGYCNCTGWTDHYWRGKALLQHLKQRPPIRIGS
jgi:hypothetical protein